MTVEIDLRWIGTRLMRLADEEGIGPGTPRTSVGAAAVYAAARLLGKRPFTQAEVVHAANLIVQTSKSRVTTYSQELFNAYVDKYGSADPSAMLGRGAVEARAD